MLNVNDMTTNGMRPIHPGEILREEFLQKLSITPAALARALNVSAPTVNDIVRERRGITADMAIRLGRCFDTTAQFWMNLQSEYALATAYTAKGEQIEHDIKPLVVVATTEAQALSLEEKRGGLGNRIHAHFAAVGADIEPARKTKARAADFDE